LSGICVSRAEIFSASNFFLASASLRRFSSSRFFLSSASLRPLFFLLLFQQFGLPALFLLTAFFFRLFCLLLEPLFFLLELFLLFLDLAPVLLELLLLLLGLTLLLLQQLIEPLLLLKRRHGRHSGWLGRQGGQLFGGRILGGLGFGWLDFGRRLGLGRLGLGRLGLGILLGGRPAALALAAAARGDGVGFGASFLARPGAGSPWAAPAAAWRCATPGAAWSPPGRDQVDGNRLGSAHGKGASV
jgi:hypothetical protein